ncbi:class I glutamine amidotransferase-like protein [Hyaloraphidium curvatum]|nr:class I glutamine amidotransferase-like protein [Hyaloraphidium curvatum]
MPAGEPSGPEKRVLRIAVIANDTVSEKDGAGYGQYDAMFSRLFDAALASAPELPFSRVELENFPAYEGTLPPAAGLADGFDAVLLTGSVSDVWEANEKRWIAELLDWIRDVFRRNAEGGKTVKVLGSCFGHQAINAALGGRVAPNPHGFENGLVHVRLTPAGRAFFGTASDELVVAEAEEDGLKVMQVHGASVLESAPGFETLASTALTPHQCTLKRDKAGKAEAFTVQWHPEFPTAVVANIVELIRVLAPEERYPGQQYEREKASLVGVGKDAPDSVATGVKMLQVAGGLL